MLWLGNMFNNILIRHNILYFIPGIVLKYLKVNIRYRYKDACIYCTKLVLALGTSALLLIKEKNFFSNAYINSKIYEFLHGLLTLCIMDIALQLRFSIVGPSM